MGQWHKHPHPQWRELYHHRRHSGEAGKAAKDAYTAATAAASNMGDIMTGQKTVGGAISQIVVDSGVELAKNYAGGVKEKLITNIIGDGAKAMSDTYMKGGSSKDIRDAGKAAALQGGINAGVDIAFDGIGDKVTEKIGLSGDKAVGSILGEKITKDMAGGAAKVIANTAAKDKATFADKDAVDLENLQEAQEQAEAAANAQAAQSFREAQKQWSKKNKE